MKTPFKFYTIVILLALFNVIVFNSETSMSDSQISTISEEDGNVDLLFGNKYDSIDFSKPYHIKVNHANDPLHNSIDYKNSIIVSIRSTVSKYHYFQTIPLINWFEQKDEITYCWMFKTKNKDDEYITVSSVRTIYVECSSKYFGNVTQEKVKNLFKDKIRTQLDKIIHKEVLRKIEDNELSF